MLFANALIYMAAGYAGAMPFTSPTEGPDQDEPVYMYVPKPPGRYTFGLFLSSVITLSLCVYKGIHLNITPDK
ncbi:hypothetical protein K440DRAFT_595985 [Wilcoxina mikolae CBS 423.85]|nr:hypothetical protein K440DRAFT_595985 [Wilcoxina mikolae CBS 423.85]